MATIKKACKGGLYPKASSVSSRLGSPSRKMKSGGSLGMKSVKAGYDRNPGVTRADIIVAAKRKAKKGIKVKKAQSGDDIPIGNKRGNLSSYSQLEPGKKFNYIEGPDRSFGVARRKMMPSRNSKVKTIQYDRGFVPSNARITKQKLDSEGKVINNKERSISVNRASKMMRKKGGDYKKGGSIKKTQK